MKKLTALCVLLALMGTLSVGGTLATSETQESTNPLTAFFKTVAGLFYEFDDDPETGDSLQIATHFLTRRADGSLASETENRLITLSSHLSKAQETVSFGDAEFQLNLWPRTSGAADQFLVVQNTAEEAVYFRVGVAIRCPSDAWTFVHTNLNDADYIWSDWEPTSIGQDSYMMAVATYNTALAAGKTAAPSLMQIAIDNSITADQQDALSSFDIQTRTFAIEADAFPKETFATAEDALDAAIPIENIKNSFN